MYLFFDTETGGLPKNYKARISESSNWPRLVQIAWACADEDEQVWFERSVIIKPVGFTIPEAASKIHGITQERAMDEGVDLKEVLLDFANYVEGSKIIVAHNINFDKKIIYAEYYRNDMEDDIGVLSRKEKICTMFKSTKLCQLPKPSGRGGYKWPKLQELHKVLFDEEFEGAHDALADIQACARCFWKLKEMGIVEVEAVPKHTGLAIPDEKGFGEESWG